jgi:pimeloyl-ACP methyl ester carboxylesterase
MTAPVTAPTLQLHGTLDACVLPRTAAGSGRYVAGPYEWRELPGVGHFPHEEVPDAVSDAIATWSR